MSEQGYYWQEALPELIEDVDWSGISEEKWEEISVALNEHVSTAAEFRAPVPSSHDIAEMNFRPERESMKAHIAELEARENAYVKHISRGRDNVHVDVRYGSVEVRVER